MTKRAPRRVRVIEEDRRRSRSGVLGLPAAEGGRRPRRQAQQIFRGLLRKRDVIVLADALKHEERRRALPTVTNEVRSSRSDRINLAGAEQHFLLGFAQEESDLSYEDVECILDVAVIMPRHLLRRRDLELADAEAGPFGMISASLDFIEMARVFDRFHFSPFWARIRPGPGPSFTPRQPVPAPGLASDTVAIIHAGSAQSRPGIDCSSSAKRASSPLRSYRVSGLLEVRDCMEAPVALPRP